MIASEAKEFFKSGISFETSGRTLTLAESVQHTIIINGKYETLMSMDLNTGERVPSWFGDEALSTSGMYILGFSLTKNEDGDMASLSITAVESESADKPYHTTTDVDVQEVQKKLVNHPRMKDEKTRFQIRMFEATEENLKFSASGDPQAMFNLKTGQAMQFPVALDDEWAIKYAKAQLLGVDTYNVYLPVVTKVSQYLKLPNVATKKKLGNYGSRRKLATPQYIEGEFNPVGFTNLGEFDNDNVPLQIKGCEKGKWFKSTDKFQQNANGSWTRTETWTYTNDLRLDWIYKDGAAKEVVIQ